MTSIVHELVRLGIPSGINQKKCKSMQSNFNSDELVNCGFASSNYALSTIEPSFRPHPQTDLNPYFDSIIKQGNIIPLELHLSLGDLPAFKVYFEGKRKAGFYILKVFLPIALIVLMSWTVFWVDPTKSEAQLTVSATSMLSLVAFLFTLSYFIPKIDYLTSLDIYLYGSMVFVFLSLAEAVLTCNLSSRKKLALARKVDRYSRVIFPVSYLALIFEIFIH